MPNIFDDHDVAAIAVYSEGQPLLNLPLLDEEERSLVTWFTQQDQLVDSDSPAKTVINACSVGVQAFEALSRYSSDDHLVGWKKFILYNTGCNVQTLWGNHRTIPESAIFGDWVVATIGANHWGPDGNQSPLGSVHSNCMALAAQAGGGIQMNPATGKFEVATGDAARSYDPLKSAATTNVAPERTSNRKRGLFRRG